MLFCARVSEAGQAGCFKYFYHVFAGVAVTLVVVGNFWVNAAAAAAAADKKSL